MTGRIHSVQTARHHGTTPIVAAVGAILIPNCRSSAENAQGGGDCKRDEGHLSNHDGFLLSPDATWIESRVDEGRGKGLMIRMKPEKARAAVEKLIAAGLIDEIEGDSPSRMLARVIGGPR
jgi:hypothetical protein